MATNGKGDKNRTINNQAYRDNYDNIFGDKHGKSKESSVDSGSGNVEDVREIKEGPAKVAFYSRQSKDRETAKKETGWYFT